MLDHKKRAYSEWLVVRSQQGDRAALNSLVKFWQERYLLYALRRLENRDAARDVTQETLISICRNLGKLKDPVTYPSWSYRILERRCLDWLRKTIRERDLIEAQAINNVFDTVVYTLTKMILELRQWRLDFSTFCKTCER